MTNKELVKSFKPCYKWNTFNTGYNNKVHNLVMKSFKPCYKWNTFNTKQEIGNHYDNDATVLNLVINGIPSIL